MMNINYGGITKVQQRQIVKFQRDMLMNREELDLLISDQVCRLLDSICDSESIVGIYINKGSEVGTENIISYLRARYRIALPKIIDENIVFSLIDIEKNLDKMLIIHEKYKILEPKDINICYPTIIIIPIIAFDSRLARLGYGGGFYDRYLRNKDVYKIGIAYDIQKVNHIQTNAHDVNMDIIVTDRNTYSYAG